MIKIIFGVRLRKCSLGRQRKKERKKERKKGDADLNVVRFRGGWK